MIKAKSDIDEGLLWQSFLSGDNGSLEKIYRIYFDELYQYGNKWLNDHTFTEDIIQDLFVKLIRTRQNLSQTTSIRFYLFRAFRSLALDKIKTDKKMIVLDEPGDEMFPVDLTPEHNLIEKQEYNLVKEKLSSALSALTPRQREAIFLRYNEGFSYIEVSEMMELTTKATYKLMARAIDALKGQLPLVFSSIFLYKIFLENIF
ncbi:MAG: sigma-70 family RNA polymerase sigma factor [Ginsengibacter sp.]